MLGFRKMRVRNWRLTSAPNSALRKLLPLAFWPHDASGAAKRVTPPANNAMGDVLDASVLNSSVRCVLSLRGQAGRCCAGLIGFIRLPCVSSVRTMWFANPSLGGWLDRAGAFAFTAVAVCGQRKSRRVHSTGFLCFLVQTCGRPRRLFPSLSSHSVGRWCHIQSDGVERGPLRVFPNRSSIISINRC